MGKHCPKRDDLFGIINKAVIFASGWLSALFKVSESAITWAADLDAARKKYFHRTIQNTLLSVTLQCGI
jgi:hypothetical protein